MFTPNEHKEILKALQGWRPDLAKAFQENAEVSSGGGSCQCEDRPCCSCDSDTYLTQYNTEEDSGDVADRWRERMEMADTLDEDQCYYCHEQIVSDNEDDLMNGYHELCGETRGN